MVDRPKAGLSEWRPAGEIGLRNYPRRDRFISLGLNSPGPNGRVFSNDKFA